MPNRPSKQLISEAAKKYVFMNLFDNFTWPNNNI